MKNILQAQDMVIDKLSARLGNYYLAGGTALAKYYFQHRESYDLDFFTQEYSIKEVREIISYLKDTTGLATRLQGETSNEKFAKMCVYGLEINKDEILKIDFVEDVLSLINPTTVVNGINTLSLDDIYIRKLYSVGGSLSITSDTEMIVSLGGRKEAKDLYDIFILSTVYLPLSSFVGKFCDNTQKERIVCWYRSFDRLDMKIGLTEIVTSNIIDFGNIDRHISKEIKKIVKGMIS